MPYYCTVPRCTSMAGKAKNVSFHQFPRDEELAKLWNNILKRGKPYTKYSKVCSLHFTPDDYTITSGQKNKGQWRTLRKDAIPSRNLPSDSPTPYQRRNSSWTPPPTAIDARMHQQMAQAIYVQTMLAMQAASITAINNDQPSPSDGSTADTSFHVPELEQTHQNIEDTHTDDDTEQSRTHTHEDLNIDLRTHKHIDNDELNIDTTHTYVDKTHTDTYKCTQCSKCFKDPDVFLLHKRTHNTNNGNTDEMLKANPILAKLLKSDGAQTSIKRDDNVFNVKNVISIENQIMAALTANMENYLRNLSTIMTHGNTDAIDNTDSKGDSMSNCDSKDFLDSNLIIDED